MEAVLVTAAEIEARRSPACIEACALGSCVAVAALDPEAGVGGIAHVMLPGRPLRERPDGEMAAQYAEPAVSLLLAEMVALGADRARLLACLVGGADVIGDGTEGPGADTARSLESLLGVHGIPVVARDLGGTVRRSCALEVGTGQVSVTLGDGPVRRLWEPAS